MDSVHKLNPQAHVDDRRLAPVEPDAIVSYAWSPPGVERIIACGSNSLIGIIDAQTVLKYPNLSADDPPNLSIENERVHRMIREEQTHGLKAEEQILRVLGHHPRVITFKAKHSDGLSLEYMCHGSVSSYLHEGKMKPSIKMRLKWSMQVTEAVAYIHTRGVLHCDINPNNMLLNETLDVILSDFQGKLLDADGAVLLDGQSAEAVKFSMPRSDPNEASCKTDIFALGTAIYVTMTGDLPFPELDPWEHEQEIVEKFRSGPFPPLDETMGRKVVYGCWSGKYESAEEVLRDLEVVPLACNGQVG